MSRFNSRLCRVDSVGSFFMLRKHLSTDTLVRLGFSPRNVFVSKSRKNDTAEAVWALTPKDCRWPLGEIKQPGFRFCCETVVEGSPYCLEHSRLNLRVRIPDTTKLSYNTQYSS